MQSSAFDLLEMKKMLICDENFEPDLEILFKMKYNFICLNFFFGSAFYKIIKKRTCLHFNWKENTFMNQIRVC